MRRIKRLFDKISRKKFDYFLSKTPMILFQKSWEFFLGKSNVISKYFNTFADVLRKKTIPQFSLIFATKYR
jgi:hypothetical protein